jgi:hypothetical protein
MTAEELLKAQEDGKKVRYFDVEEVKLVRHRDKILFMTLGYGEPTTVEEGGLENFTISTIHRIRPWNVTNVRL